MDAKFGMFLHWGLYSGAENGEWYMNWAGIPINEYRKFAYPESGDKQFTADRFNASEWAQIAKDAGMKYMNLTAMHHDGFALFESSYPKAFTAKQTLGRDLVKEYAEACRKAGLKVGIYKTTYQLALPPDTMILTELEKRLLQRQYKMGLQSRHLPTRKMRG